MTTTPKYKTPTQTRLVEMTPEMALKLLETAADNRNISRTRVVSLQQTIERGLWKVTHQGIALGEDGKLYDGQHRLWAIAESGQTVPIYVTYGLDPESREAIDKGRPRSVSDELAMFRGMKNTTTMVSCVHQCARLFTGGEQKVLIPTLSIFEEWYSCFKPGVDWSVALMSSCKEAQSPAFRKSYVYGTLAFAHATNPPAVEKFGGDLISGENLQRGMPVFTLRNHLVTELVKHGDSLAPAETTRKILRALQMTLRGKELKTLQDTQEGLVYFRKAYENARKLRSLAEPFRAAREQAPAMNTAESQALAEEKKEGDAA